MTRAANQQPPCTCQSATVHPCCEIHGTFAIGSILNNSQLSCVCFSNLLLTMPPKPKGKGKKSKGVTVSVCSAKRVRKTVKCNQAPVTPTQALGESLAESDPASSQVPVSEQLEMIMHMLVDLSNRVQDSEDQSREKATTSSISPSTSRAD